MGNNADDGAGGITCILVFIVLLISIGLSLQLIDTGKPLVADTDAIYKSRIIHFSFAAFFFSLVFSRFRTLPDKIVDFFCYSLTMLGVMFLFLNSATERKVISALGTREEWREKLQQTSTNLERKRVVLDELATIVGNPREMFSRFQSAAMSSESTNMMDDRVRVCNEINTHGRRIQVEERLKRSVHPERTQTPGSLLFYDPRYFKERDCGGLQLEWKRIAKAVKQATHPKELRAMNTASKGVSLMEVVGAGVNLCTITFETLIDYLEQAWGLETTASVLDSEIKYLGAKQNKEKMKVDAPIMRPAPKATWTNLAEQFLWLYVMISALALKLARRDYLKGIFR